MQQSAVIHDPMRVSTPSQRLAHAAKLERHRKIDLVAQAVQPSAPVTRNYQPSWEKPVRRETPKQWAERQKQIPIQTEFKEPWFHIVDEIEPKAAPEPIRPTIERIQREVCRHFNLTRDDLISQRRNASIVRPRQIAMFLAKKLTIRSFPEIGRRFDGRDHTTVLSAVRRVKTLLNSDPKIATAVAQLTACLSEAA